MNTSNSSDNYINQPLIASLYVPLLLIGFFGNLLVCYIIITTKGLHSSVTNIFIFNLSLADMLVCLLCGPFRLISDVLLFYWSFGWLMCKLVPFIQSTTVYLSALIHVIISSDRFIVVIYPLKKRISKKKAWIVIMLIWIIAILFSIPLLIVNELIVYADNFEYCEETWSQQSQLIYTIISMFAQYFVPVTFLITSYSMIIIKIWAYKIPGARIATQDRNMENSKKKMAKMAIVVALIYTLSQLPRHIIFIIQSIHDSFFKSSYNYHFFVMTMFTSTSSSCYNPFVYLYMSKKFREGALNLKYLIICKPNRQNRNGTYCAANSITLKTVRRV